MERGYRLREFAPRLRVIALLGFAIVPAPAASQSTAITHVTVVDVATGHCLANQIVVVRGNRIASVGTHVPVPRDARVVDGTGKFLIPGLWDMHVHSAHDGRPAFYWPLFIANGVTGVRNMGAYLDSLVYYRAVRDTMRAPAPRIVWSSPIIDGVQSYPHTLVARTAAEGRADVDSMRRLRFDLVKVYSSLNRETYFAIAAEAKRVGIPFGGHVPARVTPIEAADAGQRSMEHLENDVEYCTPGLMAVNATIDSLEFAGAKPAADLYRRRSTLTLQGYDYATCAAMIRVFVKRGTFQVPTLVANRAVFLIHDTVPASDVRRRYEPKSVLAGWESARTGQLRGLPVAVEDMLEHVYASRNRLTGQLARAGVPILAGTDVADLYGVFPGFALHEELALLVDAGLTPLQALQAATINPARYLRATDSLGTVAKGKVADLVLLDADPLLDIHNTTRIRAVFANGRYLDRSALDTELAVAERAAGSVH